MYYLKLNPIVQAINQDLPHIIWGHGWGQSHASLKSLAINLQHLGVHWLLDFPGFGQSQPPITAWGTMEYAEMVVSWIKQNIPLNQPIIWVGHSFGCRIGINIAAVEPKLLKGLFLIAAAGIPRPINFLQHTVKKIKIYTFKTLKHLCKITKNKQILNYLRSKFGSTDYKNADPIMRDVLIKVINEDLSNLAQKINCPTALVYGTDDQETPITIGKKFQQVIKKSKLHIIPYQNHWSLLNHENHQVVYLLKNFINDLK